MMAGRWAVLIGFSIVGLAQNPESLIPAPPSPTATGTPLTLKEVLDAVERSYPPLLVALQERQLADADVTSALGRFDVVLRSSFSTDYLGPIYDDRIFNVGIEQQLAPGGISYFTGYRVADGSFLSYEGKDVTNRLGEYRAGVRVPLLRDRAIDPRRAELARARVGRRIAELSIDQQRIVILQAATRRYWDWVAAGQRYQVAAAALDIAEKRDQFLRQAVESGALPRIDVDDNLRVILQRRTFLVEARRTLENAAFELSLFYRDGQGQPITVASSRLPKAFPDPKALDAAQILRDIEIALQRRPEITRLLAQRDQADIDIRLFRNQQMPGVDFLFSYARQLGDKLTSRGPDEVRASLLFDLPLQRRAAIGRERATEARIAQLDQRTQFQRDQIVVEVQDAISAVRAAYDRVGVLGNEVRTTRTVENAERERFELGDSNLFTLNVRELQTVDAQVRELSAYLDYYRALALYELAIANALAPGNPRP